MKAVEGDRHFAHSCAALDELAHVFHKNAVDKGFHDKDSDASLVLSMTDIRNQRFPRWCMLIVSEIAEAMEAHRCKEGDDRIAEELADAIIRILDTAKVMGLNIGSAVQAKAIKNADRPAMHGGKLY